jgi:hypothetical protein
VSGVVPDGRILASKSLFSTIGKKKIQIGRKAGLPNEQYSASRILPAGMEKSVKEKAPKGRTRHSENLISR